MLLERIACWWEGGGISVRIAPVMTITKALHEAMETLDDHASRIGSGPYASIAAELQKVANSMNQQAAETRRVFAIDLLLDVPACALSESMVKFTSDRKFMKVLVRQKGVQLQEYSAQCGAILGSAWKIEITDALLPYQDPGSLEDVRQGILTLLVARSGFLPQILARLSRLAITPRMLCPADLGVEPVDGDDGLGPSAEDFLFYEPRMLRWLLGKGEFEPWPQLGFGNQPGYMSKLIVLANGEGGDDRRVNEPCTCRICKGVRIPTVGCPAVSLTPSECGSEGVEEMVS